LTNNNLWLTVLKILKKSEVKKVDNKPMSKLFKTVLNTVMQLLRYACDKSQIET